MPTRAAGRGAGALPWSAHRTSGGSSLMANTNQKPVDSHDVDGATMTMTMTRLTRAGALLALLWQRACPLLLPLRPSLRPPTGKTALQRPLGSVPRLFSASPSSSSSSPLSTAPSPPPPPPNLAEAVRPLDGASSGAEAVRRLNDLRQQGTAPSLQPQRPVLSEALPPWRPFQAFPPSLPCPVTTVVENPGTQGWCGCGTRRCWWGRGA